MELEKWRDPTSFNIYYKLTITDHDMTSMDRSIILAEQVFLDEFNRADASIEEQLMGLQILARAIEEGQKIHQVKGG